MTTPQFENSVEKIVSGKHRDPFSFLGMHSEGLGNELVVRAFIPQAQRVKVVDWATSAVLAELPQVHEAGLFSGSLHRHAPAFVYRLAIETANGWEEIEDPYRFPAILNELDVYRIAEGKNLRLDEVLRARRMTMNGVEGIGFAVWAPQAERVSVVGSFNDWDGRRHPMRFRVECGVWELFVPQLQEGEPFKFEITSKKGEILPLKLDPFALYCERRPGMSAIVYELGRYRWNDDAWMENRRSTVGRNAPMAIYEVHLGSWRRSADADRDYLDYSALADQLVSYVQEMGFTHIGLMPVSEYTDEGSWGYRPIGLFAPTSRFGHPDEFRQFVDRCHQAGIGVIIDWAANHFPTDVHGLGRFDGTALYERGGTSPGGNNLGDATTYNYGRFEVADYLLNNALFWLGEYHIDGLRIDTLASMLYLDYGRRSENWKPNAYGGNEDLEAIDFLRRFNELIAEKFPDVVTVAGESTDWPMVSRPTYLGGLGFRFKWNTQWVRDSLNYISRDPVFRKYHHDRLTFGVQSAFGESFVLSLGHGLVAQGGPSLVARMPGERSQRFANLRVYLAYFYTHPGKKLLFMGSEFAQERPWDCNAGLDWHLLEDRPHGGIKNLVRDLNILYRDLPPLHQMDCEAGGFEWIDSTDAEKSIISYLRRGPDDGDFVIVVCNFTPVVRYGYRVGVPQGGFYEERINTDSNFYGGGDKGNAGGVVAEAIRCYGWEYSVTLTLPPLSALVLVPRSAPPR